MTKIITLYLAASFACLSFNNAYAQNSLDKRNLAEARKVLDETHDCGTALGRLRFISDSGKKSAEYLLLEAKAYDCSNNREQAQLYYKNYLEQKPNDEAVKKRVAQLADPKYNNTAAQEARAKAIYKDAKTGRHRATIDGREFNWGMAYDLYTGGNKSPYGHAISFYNIYAKPFANDHIQFEFLTELGYVSGGHKNWFAQVFNTTASNVKKVPGTARANTELALSGVIINQSRLALTAGGALGLSFILMPDIEVVTGSNVYLRNSPIFTTPIAGLRSGVYLGKHMFIGLGYSFSMRSTFKNEEMPSGYSVLPGTPGTVTPLNGNYFTIGLGLRGYGEPINSYRHGF